MLLLGLLLSLVFFLFFLLDFFLFFLLSEETEDTGALAGLRSLLLGVLLCLLLSLLVLLRLVNRRGAGGVSLYCGFGDSTVGSSGSIERFLWGIMFDWGCGACDDWREGLRRLVGDHAKRTSWGKHTKSFNCLLVAFTTSDLSLQVLGLLNDLLDGDYPTVLLLGRGGFELVGVAADLEGEISRANPGYMGGIGLLIVSMFK